MRYDRDSGVLTCPHCNREFPKTYQRKVDKLKEYGTKQLMGLWAYYNYERHIKACKEKSV